MSSLFHLLLLVGLATGIFHLAFWIVQSAADSPKPDSPLFLAPEEPEDIDVAEPAPEAKEEAARKAGDGTKTYTIGVETKTGHRLVMKVQDTNVAGAVTRAYAEATWSRDAYNIPIYGGDNVVWPYRKPGRKRVRRGEFYKHLEKR